MITEQLLLNHSGGATQEKFEKNSRIYRGHSSFSKTFLARKYFRILIVL